MILDLQMKVNRLTIENSILEKDKELNLSKIAQLTDEMQIVNWYVEVMEDGFCTKEMLRDLAIQSKRARMYEE